MAPPFPDRFRPRISEQDRSSSAILLNRNPKPVAALQAVWRFTTVNGRSYRHVSGQLSTQPLLLPFGRRERDITLAGYWQTILPGSKRYLSEGGMTGDNTDVRLPVPDEKWPKGGGMGSVDGNSGVSGGDPVKEITLALDGVFFIDGEFAGPNREKLFEQTVGDAEAHMTVARIAREGHNRGLAPRDIFAAIEEATGPAKKIPAAPPGFHNPDATPMEFREWALQRLAHQFGMQRRASQFEDERAIYAIVGWTETVLPAFRQGELRPAECAFAHSPEVINAWPYQYL
jgi:hypothetical protein